MLKLFKTAFFLASAMAVATLVQAEPVQIRHDGLRLNAELKLAPAKSVKDGVMLLVHGTLAHGRMEVMEQLQAVLAERGISTLAITLGLGIDNRAGMYDCALPHKHTNETAIAEIGAWVAWAEAQGAARISLLGHSRGGAQVAYFAANAGDRLSAKLRNIVLLAPTTFERAAAAEEYRARHGGDFAATLAKAEALVTAGKGGEMMPGTGLLYCPGTVVSAASFVSYHANDGRNDAPSLIGRIKRPLLVILAGSEEVVKGLPEKLAKAAKPAAYSQAVVDGADHFFKDLFAEDAADLIAKFWDK